MKAKRDAIAEKEAKLSPAERVLYRQRKQLHAKYPRRTIPEPKPYQQERGPMVTLWIPPPAVPHAPHAAPAAPTPVGRPTVVRRRNRYGTIWTTWQRLPHCPRGKRRDTASLSEKAIVRYAGL